MKKFIVSCSAFAFAFCALNVSAQDAEPLQPKGTWYLGSADATDLFKMFSSDGMEVSSFVGYTIADNIAITVGIDYGTATTDAAGDVPESTISSSNISLGAAYFFSDNYYAQAQFGVGSLSVTGADDQSSSAYGVGLGKFIPVKDMWYVSPQLNYQGGANDAGSSAGASISIAFGARF